MRRLYDFIKSVNNNKINQINCYENTINMEFSYFTGLENILSFEKMKNLNELYPNVLSIYKCKSAVEEIDINDFLTDKEEYEEEIVGDDFKECKFKLSISNNELVKCIIEMNSEHNTLVYFDKNSFLNELKIEPQYYRKLEQKIFSSNKNIIIIIDSDMLLYNDFCIIIGLNRGNLHEEIKKFVDGNKSLKKEICELRNISCSWVDSTKYLNPNHTFFYRDNIEFSVDEEIICEFMKITVNLAMLSICNFSGEIEDTFKSIINGNKRIEIIYNGNINYDYSNARNIYTIYNWIYDIPSIDKLNICRNVISALIVAKCQGNSLITILENSESLLNSLNDNFENYTQENINKFFEERNNNKKALLADIKEITDQTESIIKLIVNNMTSLIAVSIAGVVVYIAKSSFLVVKILGILYVLQLDLSLLLSIPINIFKYNNTANNFKNIKEQYEELYFKDKDISIYDEKMNKTKKLLKLYICITLIIVVIVNFISWKIVYDAEYLKWILSFIN